MHTTKHREVVRSMFYNRLHQLRSGARVLLVKTPSAFCEIPPRGRTSSAKYTPSAELLLWS